MDCDGTIREPSSRAKFISSPDDQKIIKGANDAIARWFNERYTAIGITNQAGVAAGHKSLDDTIKEQQITLKLSPQIQSILLCPDYEGNQCFHCYPNKWFEISNK